MPVICKDLNLLFIMMPGTGCSVVATVLCEQFGGERLPDKHASVAKIIADGSLTQQQIADLTVFGTVRNPFDRFVTEYTRIAGDWFDDHFSNHSPRSQWIHEKGEKYRKWKRKQQKKARDRGFDWWLMGTIRRYQIRQLIKHPFQYRKMMDLLAYPMTEGVDRLMVYENLEEDLKSVLSDAGADTDFTLPRKNITPGKKDFHEYYSPKSRRFIERTFADALKRYGHTFDDSRVNS
jgi:hypothetical protein